MTDNADRIVIEGVDPYELPEPLFEAVRIVLSQRGAPYTSAYVQGVSGAAFRIAGICPCAPTCSAAMMPMDLAKLLGYDVAGVSLESVGADWTKLEELAGLSEDGLPPEDDLADAELRAFRAALVDMVEQVKGEIRAGRSAVVWHAFTWAENDVVVGFDDSTGEFVGFGSYAGSPDDAAGAPLYRTLTAAQVGGWPSALFIGDQVAEPDLKAIELEALREAVRHGRADTNVDDIGKEPWTFLEGLRAYDQWIEHFGNPEKKRDMGDAYCYGIYRTTHRAAAAFLREIAAKHPRLEARLLVAADHFEAESGILQGAEGLLWWESEEGPDPERNAAVVDVLAGARAEYAAGIEAIETALQSLVD